MKKALFITIATLFAVLVNQSPAVAITQEDRRAINLGVPLYYGGNIDTCAGQGGDIETGIDFDLGPLEDGESRRVNLIRALMNDLDLTAEQAAGIVGNFAHESGGSNLPPDANEILGLTGDGPGNPPREVVRGTNTGGYGWAQWTGGRKTAFISYAVENGYMDGAGEPFTDAANYAYLLHELSNDEDIVAELQGQSTVRDATILFLDLYERAGTRAVEARVSKAEQAFDEYNAAGPLSTGDNRECRGGSGSAAISGDHAFPLLVTKSQLNNPEMFRNGSADDSHPNYTAYDILVDEGTPVAAFMDGEVINVGEDKCPGRSIGIYNKEENLTVSYLHLSFNAHIGAGETVSAGDRIGVVGSDAEGCTISHLHIDVVTGEGRPGCQRSNCPASDRFVDIGAELFETYQLLVD